jgi:hypothetical protein
MHHHRLCPAHCTSMCHKPSLNETRERV